jgi:hypothetical protein
MTKAEERRLLVVAAIVGMVGVMVPCLVCAFSAWYIANPPPALRSWPVPPGTKEDQLGAQTEWADWERILEVEQPYTEVVAFYKDVMPGRGWELVEEHSYKRQTGSVWSCLVYRRFSTEVQVAVIGREEGGVPTGGARVFISIAPLDHSSMCQGP